jgi:hypothetical protein
MTSTGGSLGAPWPTGHYMPNRHCRVQWVSAWASAIDVQSHHWGCGWHPADGPAGRPYAVVGDSVVQEQRTHGGVNSQNLNDSAAVTFRHIRD